MVHQRDAGAGIFGEAVRSRGLALDTWMPAEAEPPELDDYSGVFVFGGAMNVDQRERHPWLAPEKQLLRRLLEHGTPTLGVCLGAQLVAEAAGAEPRRAREPEIGWFTVELEAAAADDPLFAELPPRFTAFQWHSYEAPLPPGAVPLARSPVCLQGYRVGDSAWGIQFHAEATEEIARGWADDFRSDEDAVRIGLDPEALRRETAERMPAWNELGRGLCNRFLDYALTRA